MPTVLLVRHAQASFGSADYDVLSALGIRQAGLLATTLGERELNVTRVASGPARRQRDTAAACAALGPEVEVDERWDEYEAEAVLATHAVAAVGPDGLGAGGMEITSRDFQGVLDEALAAWVGSGEESDASQTWPQFLGSRSAALGEFAAGLGSGETGVVFTSGGVIAAVCTRLLGGHADLFPRLNRVLVNTGITKLAVGRAGTSLVTFNEHAHIDAAGAEQLSYR